MDFEDTGQDHTWLTSINEARGPVLAPVEWATAVRLRQGCRFMAQERACAGCGSSVSPTDASHALLCAPADSTRGHNELRDELAAILRSVDPGTETEVQGLVPSAPSLRPADILTRAAHSTLDTAIDVTIKAPHACGAGGDCVDAGRREKMTKYGPILPELRQQGIRYVPVAVSCFGRRGQDLDAVLRAAAVKFVRQAGSVDHKRLQRKWEQRLSVVVWRRAARMVHRCLWQEQDPWDVVAAVHDAADHSRPGWLQEGGGSAG